MKSICGKPTQDEHHVKRACLFLTDIIEYLQRDLSKNMLHCTNELFIRKNKRDLLKYAFYLMCNIEHLHGVEYDIIKFISKILSACSKECGKAKVGK